MFRLYIEETINIYFNSLPAKLQAQCLIDLGEIRKHGVTACLPGNMVLAENGHFQVICVEETHKSRIENWIDMRGKHKVEDGKPKEIFITSLTGYICGKQIGPQWKKDTSRCSFIEVDLFWLKSRKANRFVSPILDKLFNEPKIDDYLTSQAFLKRTFHRGLVQIKRHKAYHDTYGGHLDTCSSKCRSTTNVVQLGPEQASHGKATPLSNLLNSLKRSENTPYIVVNFIDQTDPFFHAQLGLITHLTHWFNRHTDDVHITVLDVIIKDKDGKEYYQEEFKQFHKNAPSHWSDQPKPFSMLLFSAFYKTHNQRNIRQLSSANYKTLYLDLFLGCRDGSESDGQFLKNRDVVMHEMYAAMFNTSPIAILEVKDLRGCNEEKVQDVLNVLAKEAMAIRVNGTWKYLESIKEAFTISYKTGYPYLVIVLADGDEDVVTLQSGLYSEHHAISDLSELRVLVEALYESFILMTLPGNHTVNNLYSGFDLGVPERIKQACAINSEIKN